MVSDLATVLRIAPHTELVLSNGTLALFLTRYRAWPVFQYTLADHSTSFKDDDAHPAA